MVVVVMLVVVMVMVMVKMGKGGEYYCRRIMIMIKSWG